MKYGIFLPTMADSLEKGSPQFAPNYNSLNWDNTLEYVKQVEKLGFESIWVPDHLIMGKGDAIFDSLVVLSALASATTSIHLGTVVLCSIFRHPGILAKMFATLDFISHGRALLGIGSGWYTRELEAFNFPPVDRVRTKEVIEILQLLWKKNNKPINYQGKYYKLSEAVSKPSPIQDPLPIYVGGGSDKTLEITTNFANGWITSGPLERCAQQLERLKFYLEKNKRNNELTEIIWFGRVLLTEESEKEDNQPTVLVGSLNKIDEKITQLEQMGFTKVILAFPDFPNYEKTASFAKYFL